MDKKGKIDVKFIVGTLVIILLLLQQVGVFSKDGIKPFHKEVSFSLPINYELKDAKKITIKSSYEESGMVTTKVKANLSPQMMGVIMKINATAGQKVKKGDVLVEIASDRMGSKVGQVEKSIMEAKSGKQLANQQLLRAKAAFEQADKHYKRMKDFYKKSAATKVMLEDAESKYKQAKAMVKSAEQGVEMAKAGLQKAMKYLKEAKIGLSYANIVAPFSGIITRRMKDPGDMATPGHPVLVLNNLDEYRLEVNVRENLKKYIKMGQKLDVEVGERKYTGIVDEIVPQVDPMTRTFTIKVAFEPKEDEIFIGMYGKVYIQTDDKEIIVAPKKSINRIGQINMVLVKFDNSAYRRYVKLGNYEDNENIQIISGISEGDKVIIKGE